MNYKVEFEEKKIIRQSIEEMSCGQAFMYDASNVCIKLKVYNDSTDKFDTKILWCDNGCVYPVDYKSLDFHEDEKYITVDSKIVVEKIN